MKQQSLCLIAVLFLCVASPGWAQLESPADSLRSTALHNLQGHLGMTMAAGQLGSDPLFSFQLGFFASRYFGMEASISHNPSGSTHAALHRFDGVIPVPALWRIRPFATAGIGTIEVFPGTAINAKSVTKLTWALGGGANLFLRDDIALRFEGHSFSIIDNQEDTKGTLGFAQWSIGLTFYRTLLRSALLETGAGQ